MSVITLPGWDKRPGRVTLRWKLMAIISIVTILATLLMVLGLMINNRYFFERTVERDLSIVAEVVGNNSQAALTFGDAKAATTILAALRADSHITAAGLYDDGNRLFASYRPSADAAALPATAVMADGERTSSGRIEIMRAIDFNGKSIGKVFIRSDTGRWDAMVHQFLAEMGVVMAVTIAVMLLLSLRLQRYITAPITHLADISRTVSRERNYRLRAEKSTSDEIGDLVDDFNTMLSEIEARNGELRSAQHELQQHVNELNREVRERRNAESALRDSETRYRILFENNPMPMWLCDIEDRRFIAVNDAMIQRYGYTRAELLAMAPNELSPDAERASALSAEADVKPASIRIHRRKDGSLIKAEVISHNVLFGGRRCEIAIANDVTERLQAEESLRRYSDRLKLLNGLDRAISSSLDIHELFFAYVQGLSNLLSFDRTTLLIVDESGKGARVVDQWSSASPIIPAGTQLSMEDRGMIRAVRARQPVLDNELNDNDPLSESAVLRKEGILSRIIMPLVVKNRVIGILTVASRAAARLTQEDLESLMPIADQMAIALNNAQLYEQIQQNAAELERRVAERTAQLKASNEELEAFSYSVSHDLRAPLRALDGFSTALMGDYAAMLDAQGQHYLKRIRHASQRMGHLIDDMLNLSRVTRSKLVMADVDFSRLAGEVMADYVERYPDRRLEWVVAEDMSVEGDANLLRIALDNLIGNAWKFTQRQPDARIEIGKTVMDGNTLYFVSDNGVGFDMAYADKLFGAFQRLHSNEDFEGTGIGLATVKRIIGRHGGRLWAEAEAGKGATFYFTMKEDKGEQ